MNAKLALRAITLRGIGSYLHGARLEVRPLTILCGTNGSGKSTWLKAMNMLKASMGDELFPFRWSVDDVGKAHDIELTNAFMQLEADMGEYNKRAYSFLTDESLDRNFGPPCTIGLEFEAAQDFTLPQHEYGDIDLDTVCQPFLWSGHCPRGTRFRIRLSHPTSVGDESVVSGFYHLIELQLDNEFAIRFFTSNQISARYTVECSAAFLPGFAAAPENRNIQIAECSRELKDVSPTNGVVDEDDAKSIVASAARRISELLREVLTGYFYLSAIRQSHSYSHLENANIDENLDLHALIDARHVGPQGEATWWLERKFACNRMEPVLDSQPGEPTSEKPLFEEFVSRWSETLLQTSIEYSQPLHSPWEDTPTGFLIDPQPLPDENEDAGDLARLLHPCFENEPQLPKQMSSGFHQLMPLIVQAGLMRQHEIMAVENPEVHLHPRLQLQVAEFLMRQANSGKWIIIETHSDLIIRRVIREILEESIPIGQSKIEIYFASVEKSEEGYQYSTLKPIEIDNMGRIANWPSGFMDDDVNESRRLFKILYGDPPDATEEELE